MVIALIASLWLAAGWLASDLYNSYFEPGLGKTGFLETFLLYALAPVSLFVCFGMLRK